MKKALIILLSLFSSLILFASCDMKPQQNGEMYLETVAKDSKQAKDAEAKVNEAAAKANADIEKAMKQAQQE